MPELPEVETVRRRLAPVLEGATIERVEIADPRLTRPVDPDIVAGSTSSGGSPAAEPSSSTSA